MKLNMYVQLVSAPSTPLVALEPALFSSACPAPSLVLCLVEERVQPARPGGLTVCLLTLSTITAPTPPTAAKSSSRLRMSASFASSWRSAYVELPASRPDSKHTIHPHPPRLVTSRWSHRPDHQIHTQTSKSMTWIWTDDYTYYRWARRSPLTPSATSGRATSSASPAATTSRVSR